MLSLILLSFFWKKTSKTGFYIDFLFKLLLENFIRYVLVWGAIFVSEKFIIEYTARYFWNNLSTPILIQNSPSLLLRVIVGWFFIGLMLYYILMWEVTVKILQTYNISSKYFFFPTEIMLLLTFFFIFF